MNQNNATSYLSSDVFFEAFLKKCSADVFMQKKCSCCRHFRPCEDFVKDGRDMKTCAGCRNALKTRYDNRKTNLDYVLREIKYSAARRQYVFDLADDVATHLITSACFYCGVLPIDRLNGIDRMDSAVDYVDCNCVPCCTACNMSKECLDARTFIERCAHISGMATHDDAWNDATPGSFSQYKYSAKKREFVFEITKDDYLTFTQLPCRFCRREITPDNKSGIDRIDNDLGYVDGNLQPCCGECNHMRGRKSVDDFLDMCARVARYNAHVPDMPRCRRAVTRRKNM